MKKDLKSSKKDQKARRRDTHGAAEAAFDGLTGEQEKLVKSLQGKSQQELQETFLRTARQQILQGTFDESAILRLIERLGPMITPEQREKMLHMLKSV